MKKLSNIMIFDQFGQCSSKNPKSRTDSEVPWALGPWGNSPLGPGTKGQQPLGPWAHGTTAPWAQDLGPFGPAPWAQALRPFGPAPWAQALRPSGPWAQGTTAPWA